MVCTKGSFVKFVLVAFNIIFLAFGLTLLALGIYAKIESNTADDYLRIINRSDGTFSNFGSIGIVAGVFCLLLGFTGFIGICKENKTCLIFFTGLVTLIFVLDLTAAGLAYGFHSKIESTIMTGMLETVGLYDGSNAVSTSWDNIQKTQECCGVVNSSDWSSNNNTDFNNTLGYPSSCVCDVATNCTRQTPSTPNGGTFQRGCFTQVDQKVLSNWKAWGGAAIAFAVFNFIGIVFGIIAIRDHGKGYHLA